MIKKGELITGRTQVLVFLKAEDKNFIDPRVKNKSSLSPSKNILNLILYELIT